MCFAQNNNIYLIESFVILLCEAKLQNDLLVSVDTPNLRVSAAGNFLPLAEHLWYNFAAFKDLAEWRDSV